MNTTTCLICKRVGSGFGVRTVIIEPKLVPGSKIMSAPCKQQITTGFSKWTNSYDCTDPRLVTAIYLYDLTVPGEWCQIFWECPNLETATKLRAKLTSDLTGTYLVDRLLSDLSSQEIAYYQRKYLDA